jgi:hypothetical protein
LHGNAAGTVFPGYCDAAVIWTTDALGSKNFGVVLVKSVYFEAAPWFRNIITPFPALPLTCDGPVWSPSHQIRLRSDPNRAYSSYGSPTVFPKPVAPVEIPTVDGVIAGAE